MDEFGHWSTSRENDLLPTEETIIAGRAKKRRKKTRAPAIRNGRVTRVRDEDDPTLDGQSLWNSVEIDEHLAWGCTEGGFLELEELDEAVEEVVDPITGGRVFSKPRQTKDGFEVSDMPVPATDDDATRKKSAQKTPAKASKLEAKKAKLEAALAAVSIELAQHGGKTDPAGATQLADEGGEEQAAEKEQQQKKKKKNKKKKKKKLGKREREAKRQAEAAEAAEAAAEATTAGATDISEWVDLRVQGVDLHEAIMSNLQRLGFGAPTPIQAQALPAAIVRRADVIGGAMTGSGKTLAFGIPMVHKLLLDREAKGLDAGDGNPELSVSALVLTPTRELAIQVCDHIKMITKGTPIRAVPLVGGMSSQKQQRLLQANPEIVVATPGRFFELLKDGEAWLRVHRLQFFVLDEADRMVEAGHFEELSEILDMLPRGDEPGASKRQVFLFTATLHASGVDGVGRERKTLDILMKRVPFKGQPTVIDLSDSAGIKDLRRIGDSGKNGSANDERAVVSGPAGLRECSILCENSKKDEYLYYFLCRYPGRTIVFVNAISSIRRLVATLDVLKLHAVGLHSNMQQRARLKAVDRFMASEDVVLVATDVAARGIDIKDVKYVVHYQIPKSTDTYVHRRGRTARAGAEGMSMALVGEGELQLMRRILREMGYNGTRQLPTFPVDHNYMPALRQRLAVSKKIDEVVRKNKKQNAEHQWLQQAAKDLEVDLDDDDHADLAQDGRRARKEQAALQRELDRLLQAPLLPQGFSTRHLAMDGTLAGRILASTAASRKGLPVRQGNAMTVEVDGTALHALEMSKKEADSSIVGIASENVLTTENAMAAAALKKSKRPNKRKRSMKTAPASKQGKRTRTASGADRGGGGTAAGGRIVGGVYFPG